MVDSGRYKKHRHKPRPSRRFATLLVLMRHDSTFVSSSFSVFIFLLKCLYWSEMHRCFISFVILTVSIPEEQLQSCGAADCGLNISVNGTTTRPAQTLVWTLVGCYIGNAHNDTLNRKRSSVTEMDFLWSPLNSKQQHVFELDFGWFIFVYSHLFMFTHSW